MHAKPFLLVPIALASLSSSLAAPQHATPGRELHEFPNVRIVGTSCSNTPTCFADCKNSCVAAWFRPSAPESPFDKISSCLIATGIAEVKVSLGDTTAKVTVPLLGKRTNIRQDGIELTGSKMDTKTGDFTTCSKACAKHNKCVAFTRIGKHCDLWSSFTDSKENAKATTVFFSED